MLARLIPDGATRAQILAFFEQNPWLAAQVPGGVVEFVQMMAEMPEDALHELMLGAEMMREGGGGVQPGLADRGAMPGELLPEEEAEVFWEAEDGGDDVDDLPHGHDRVNTAEDGEEDEEEEDEEEEDVAVSMRARHLRTGFVFLKHDTFLADAYPCGTQPSQPALGTRRCAGSGRFIR